MVKIKNLLMRPRVFSIVNANGQHDELRFNSKEIKDVDPRLLTREILYNIRGEKLRVLSGDVPTEKALKPYKLKIDPAVANKAKEDALKMDALDSENLPLTPPETPNKKGGDK